MEEEKTKDVKKKKHTLRNAIIILLILIIILLCGTYALHTQKLLPDTIENALKSMLEPIDKILGINQEEEKTETEEAKTVEEKTIYKVIRELDENYKDENIQIIDSINVDTTQFEKYSEEVRENVSIIIKDQKQGLINNKTGKVEVEPKYDYIIDEFINTENEEYFIGGIDSEIYKINLKTFKEEKVDELPGHGGGSLIYYEPTKKELYTNEYEYQKVTAGSAYDLERIKSYGGNNLDICFELSEDGHETNIKNTTDGKMYDRTNRLKVGYYNAKTGKLEIKTEYDKGTLFDNGIAAVSKDGKTYFINEENEKVYDVEFEDATNIHNNKAWIKIDGTWKYVEFDSTQRIDIEEKEVSKDKENEEWKEIYKEFILNGGLEESDFIWSEKNPCITFVDINNDDIPELLYFDGMEPGPRAIQLYIAYYIVDGKVEEYCKTGEICTQSNGIFEQIGYDEESGEYAFQTSAFGVSAMEACVITVSKDGIDEHITEVEKEDVFSLEDEGYEMTKLNLKETELLSSYSDKEKENAIQEAFDNYLPNSELVK